MATGAMQPAIQTQRSLTRVAHFDAVLPAGLAAVLWQRPGELLAAGAQLRSSRARDTVRAEWGGGSFIVKHYMAQSWRHAVKQAVTSSRAWQTWQVSQKLADAGIATPRPLACIENRWGGLRRDSYLVYPYIEGRTLGSCLAESQSPADQPQIDHIWRQLNALWQRLRALRVSLSDANAGNFIVDADWVLWVIDLDKTRFCKSAAAANRLNDARWAQLQRSTSWASPPSATARPAA